MSTSLADQACVTCRGGINATRLAQCLFFVSDEVMTNADATTSNDPS